MNLPAGTVLIGEFSDTPKTCGTEHYPGCFNADMDITACLCGGVWWRGNQGAWFNRHLYSSRGRDAVLLGYDIYYLGPCPDCQ